MKHKYNETSVPSATALQSSSDRPTYLGKPRDVVAGRNAAFPPAKKMKGSGGEGVISSAAGGDPEHPPGYKLRRKYGTVGAGYYSTGVVENPRLNLRQKQRATAAAKVVVSKLLPSIIEGVTNKQKSVPKKIKLKMYNELKKSMSTQNYKRVAGMLLPYVVGLRKQQISKPSDKRVKETLNNLARYMAAFAEVHVKAAGAGKQRHRRKRKISFADVARYAKKFYSNFSAIAKPAAAVLAPLMLNVPALWPVAGVLEGAAIAMEGADQVLGLAD